jgi:hypothetical protein
VALSFGVVGIGAALVRMPAALLVLLPVFAILGLVVALVLGAGSTGDRPWDRVRRVCRVALLSGSAAGALAGLFALVGPGAFLVPVLLASTSPRALRACRRWLRSMPRPTASQLDALAQAMACATPMYLPFELSSDVRLLSDDQLRNAWRNSERAVRTPSSPRALWRAVEERGRYLDELERRRPGLLKAWLSCHAGAPDGPLPLARASGSEPPTIDWDELTGGQATDR